MSKAAKKENIRYCLLQGCYMMLMCSAFNYVTYYLLDLDIPNDRIGILIAVGCTVAVVLQQILGRMVDIGTLEAKKLLLLLVVLQAALGFTMVFLRVPALTTVMFGMILCSILVIQPILNSFTFYYENEGITINYGIARGIGSLCFSGVSVALGYLTANVGSFMVPLCLGAVSAVIFLILLTMPSLKGSHISSSGEKPKSTFRLTDYPAFIWMLAGLSMVMLFHNMVMTYFIYVIQKAGGDSSHMGIAIGISGIVEIPVLFFYTKIRGNRSSRVFLAASGAAFFAKAALFIVARNIGMIYAIQCLQCLAYGLMAASRVYYVDEVVGKENEATGQSCMSATETIGIVLGSVVGGFLMNAGGVDLLLWVGAAVCLAGMLCMFMGARKGRQS